MGTVLYKDYTAAVSPVNIVFGSWSGNRILKTVEDFGSGVVLGTSIVNTSALPTSEGMVHNQDFICPLPLSANTVIDGPAYGSVGTMLWNMTGSGSGLGVTLKKVYINIFKRNSSNVDTSFTGDFLIWSGTKYLDGGTYPNTAVTSVDTFPFWVENINNIIIGRNERIGMRVKLYGYATSGYTDSDRNRIYVACDHTIKQTSISLPIAVSVD